MASASGAMSAKRGTKRKTSGDTIEVKQKISTITISDNSDDGADVRKGPVTRKASSAGTNRPWGRKGKAPVQDEPAIEQAPVPGDDDYVEEYDLTDESEIEDEDDDLDTHSVISLSSEASEKSDVGINQRPWKDFSPQMREQWELMYSAVTMHPVNGDWETTEDYQREKDHEMLRYMEDFPLAKWIIPQDQANQAYFRLLERTRWRSLGIRIYGRERIPEWVPGSTTNSRIQQPLNIPRDKYPREQPREPPRPSPSQPPPSQHGPPPPHMQQQMHPQQRGPPQGPPHGPPLPPPPNALPSQPHAQPIPVPPGMHYGPQGPHGPHGPPGHHGPPLSHGIGRPIGLPQNIPYGQPGMGPPGWPPHHMMHSNFPPMDHSKPRGREKKEVTPINQTPPPPPPTPPYEMRKKPVEKKASGKAGRKSARRQAEAEEFPWTRKLNFPEEKAKATWDDSVYDPVTLTLMDATRLRNVAIIDELDAKVQEQQRIARAAKKNRAKKGPESSDAEGKQEKKKREGRKGETGGDPYHSGAFAFASEADEKYAAELGFKTPEEALDAAEADKLDSKEQGKIGICWNPGKKGTTEDLKQVKFSVRDTIATRKQLEKTPILNKRAAECIVDFCPDMLWRGMLLRITSEAGYGNKDVRDRFCYNGCYCDKATITKRISAALGQKQVQPKSKGYAPGEYEWYDENVKDFSKYIDYFGKRSTHRNMLKIQMQGEKRRAKMLERMSNANGGEDAESSDANNDAKEDDNKDADGDQNMDDDEDHDSDDSDDSNAVSVQDSDILDKMDD